MIIAPNIENFIAYIIIVATISFLLLVLPMLLAPTRSFSSDKLSAYECGFEPFRAPNEVVEHHFIIVAILFVIFDLELVFLFPWAVSPIAINIFQFWIMFIFLGLLTFTLIYEWVRGALTWPIFFSFKRRELFY